MKLSQRTKNNLLSGRKGFTLIEVLVAATIIGLLSTIGVTGFQAITRSGRDAVRKSDLEQIRSALEIYKSEINSYPAGSGCSASSSLVPNYINNYPVDPKDPTNKYCYTRLSTLTYILCAHLENGGTGDYDCDNNPVVPPALNNDCTTNCNYKVANP